MTELFPIKVSVIQWACERAGTLYSALIAHKDFKRLSNESNGYVHLTMKNVEKLSKVLRYPQMYFFYDAPVESIDRLQIADFRTFKANEQNKPSLNLLDQIKASIRHQNWFEDFAIENDLEQFKFNKKFDLKASPVNAAKVVSEDLHIAYTKSNNSNAYLNDLREILESNNIIVEISKVSNNSKNRLDVNEFRGFALSSENAPLIFVNGNDAIHAQIFTLCHELGHICLGQTGLSDVKFNSKDKVEKWCNEFAANILMPENDITNDFNNSDSIQEFLRDAVKKYHVSSFALIVRLNNLKLIDKSNFSTWFIKCKRDYEDSINLALKDTKNSKGGNFYNTFKSRSSTLFTKALLSSALVGETPFRDAVKLLGVSSIKTMDNIAKKYGLLNE